MSTVKPITNTFGNYPHSAEEIFASPDPQRTYALLRENLSYQLQMRPQQLRTLRGAMHRSTEKKLQKLLKTGWTVQAHFREPLLRRVQYDLTRPQVSKEEADFLGWK